MIGAPFVNSARLCEEMRGYHLPGVLFRRTWFTPMFNKYAGTVCEGVELHITDRRAYRPIETMLYLYRHMRSYSEFEPRREGLALRFGTDLLTDEYDIKSYKEIVAFFNNKSLTHEEKIEEKAKWPYQKVILTILSGVIAFIVFILLEVLIG